MAKYTANRSIRAGKQRIGNEISVSVVVFSRVMGRISYRGLNMATDNFSVRAGTAFSICKQPYSSIYV